MIIVIVNVANKERRQALKKKADDVNFCTHF